MLRQAKRWLIPVMIIAGLLALILVGKLVVKASNKRAEAKIYRDIPYVEGSSDPFQQLDLYVPGRGKGPFPVVVWIHGGAWVAGDKNHPPAPPLIAQGYAVASINYRLAQNAPHPAQINDCKAAVRWVRKNAVKYNLDAGHIGSWGQSAGGHLSALLAVTGDVDEIHGSQVLPGGPPGKRSSSAVDAACNWCGPNNLASLASQQGPHSRIDFNSPHGPVAVFLGGASPVASPGASPINHLGVDDPPLLIVHGAQDDTVPVEQAVEMCEKMKKIGARGDCLIIPSEGHALSSSLAIERTLDFFKEKLQLLKTTHQPQPK